MDYGVVFPQKMLGMEVVKLYKFCPLIIIIIIIIIMDMTKIKIIFINVKYNLMANFPVLAHHK